MHGEGNKPHSLGGIKALYGLHQANIPFLNEVCLGQTVARVTPRNMYDKPEVRQNQLSRRIDTFLVIQALCQLSLPLCRQHSNAADSLNVSRQVGAWGHIQHRAIRQRELLLCLCHVFASSGLMRLV